MYIHLFLFTSCSLWWSQTCLEILSLAIFLDYAAHIAHTFMITPGENGDKRAIQTLADIGPAVMNGGFSTFLAFITTCASESHVFLTFFKVKFLSQYLSSNFTNFFDEKNYYFFLKKKPYFSDIFPCGGIWSIPWLSSITRFTLSIRNSVQKTTETE